MGRWVRPIIDMQPIRYRGDIQKTGSCYSAQINRRSYRTDYINHSNEICTVLHK